MTVEMIGRDTELAVIQASLERSADGLRALVLEGDAGIGKSTLWHAAVETAREQAFLVLTSRPAEAERTLPYVVLGDLFADAGPDVLAALPGPRRRAFESALLREDPDGPLDPRALGAAILSLLPVIADGRPVVLAIDDEQWVDASSAAVLDFALRRSLHQPITLLLSRRLEAAPATKLDGVVDPAQVERLRVSALSAGAIQLLLRRRLGATFSRPTLLRLHEVSGGNPFYALELGRAHLADSPRDATLPLLVPANLERLVAARIHALDAPSRGALLLIAAHGRLPVGLLDALGVPPQALDPAFAANLVEKSGEILRFSHPLLATALYQGAARDERRDTHRRLATALDDPLDRGRHLALGADTPDADLAHELEAAAKVARERGTPIAAAELGEHALRLTPAGAIDERQRRAVAAARAHWEAGEGSRARSIAADLLAGATAGPRRAETLILGSELAADPGSAIRLLQQALTEAAAVPALEAVIHARLAESGRFTNGGAWAEGHARASLRLAERLDDDALRASALSILALVRFERGDRQALELAERAYRLAEGLADPRQVQWAAWCVGAVLLWTDTTEQAREWLERRLSDWRDRDEEVRAELVWHLALVEWWSGRWSIASSYADEVLEIDISHGRELSPDHFPPALIALHRGQFSVARDHSQRGLDLGRGQLFGYYFAILGICDLWSGSHTTALTNFARAEQTADARGQDEPTMRWWRAEAVEALLQAGRIDDAVKLVADWESAAKRLGRERVLAPALRCRGLIAAARGDLPTALRDLEEAVERHEGIGDPFGRARALLALGVVRRRARQKRTARAALEGALAGFEALGAMSWVATARAELARIGGRARVEGLSASEMPVAKLVADGLTNREIASALFLSETTVASHLSHIYAKLGVRSRTELTRQMPPDDRLSGGDPSKIHPS